MDLEEEMSNEKLEAASFGYRNNSHKSKNNYSNNKRRVNKPKTSQKHNLASAAPPLPPKHTASSSYCDDDDDDDEDNDEEASGYTGLTDYSGYEPTTTTTTKTMTAKRGKSPRPTTKRNDAAKRNGTETILNMLEDRVCTSLEYIENSDAMRDMEDHLHKFHKLEEQLEKLKRTDLWQFWQDIAETGGDNGEDKPPPPLPIPMIGLNDDGDDAANNNNNNNIKSNSLDDLFEELENNLEEAERKRNAVIQASKHKAALQNKTTTATKLPKQNRPLGPNNSKGGAPPPNMAEKLSGSSRKKRDDDDSKVDFIKTDKIRNVTRVSSLSAYNSSPEKKSSRDNIKDDSADNHAPCNLPLSEIQLPLQPLPEETTKQQQQNQLAAHHHMFDGMSAMTEDHLDMFSYLAEYESSRSCIRIPRIGMKNKFDVLKRMKSVMGSSSSLRSADSLPVMRMVTESKSTNPEDDGNAVPIFYIYDYESPNHAYVAYFRRGDTASNGLHLYQHPKPADFVTAKSEVLVQITASTVSPTDACIRKGEWWGETSPNALTLPIVPGVTFAGKVDHIDEHISMSKSGIKKGDRVVSLVRVGANSRHLCIDHERLVKVPSDIRDSDALACLPEIYLAAFQALHFGTKNASRRYKRNSLAQKKILVLGGAGVLGRALIEVARASGAGTIYATGREKEFDLITDIGGLPLSRDPKHWLSAVVGKMDIVVTMEAPYAKPELKYDHIRTLSSDGRLVVIGAPDQGDRTTVEIDTIEGGSMKTKRMLHNYNVFDSWESDMKQAKRDLSHVLRLYKEGAVKPQILDRIPLNKIAKAHEFFETKKVTGFVLCEPWITGTKKGYAAPSPIVVHKKLACENRQAMSVPSHAPASVDHLQNGFNELSNGKPVSIYHERNVRPLPPPPPPPSTKAAVAPPRSNIPPSLAVHHQQQQPRQRHHEHHLEQHHSNAKVTVQSQSSNPAKMKEPYEILILGAKRDRALV